MDNEVIYQNTLEYLYSFVDYSLTRNFRNTPDKFDLNRMREFMGRLGRPDQKYPIIHVAGTKGKGSVSALCASALQAAGYQVGLYTSPHLQDYVERIRFNGQPIPHMDFVALVDEIRPLLDGGTHLTTFEITTALAFLYFAKQGATAMVAEVGLGGRLDATNIVNPIVAVITSLSYDHTNILGNTLAEIAAEKAGVIKPGVPVVVSPQKEEARQVVERIAAERAAPLIQVGEDYRYKLLSHSVEGQTLLVWSAAEQALADKYPQGGGLVELKIPLLGFHQVENAATAWAALQVARTRGLEVNEAQIRDGFARVSWPGRFEILSRQPLVVIDSAHNRDSALKLRLALDDYFPGVPVVMLFGASEDKDVRGMFEELLPRVRQVIVTRSFHPRAMGTQELADLASELGCPAMVVKEVEDALEEALHQAGDRAMVLATGSIFIAAGVRHTWYNRTEHPG
jgi:dihydrofolate synthase/folylpolyglutamate synthase